MIVENIIPRNVIINRGAAEVDNHISRDDIFDHHPRRECDIYFIIPNIRSLIFGSPSLTQKTYYGEERSKGKIMNSLLSIFLNEIKSFTKNVFSLTI